MPNLQYENQVEDLSRTLLSVFSTGTHPDDGSTFFIESVDDAATQKIPKDSEYAI